jgi:hypothetical protein
VSDAIRPHILNIVAEDKNSKTSQFLEEIKGSDYDIFYLLKLILGKTYENTVPEKAIAVSQNFILKLVGTGDGSKFASSACVLLNSRGDWEKCNSRGAYENDNIVIMQFDAARSLLESFCIRCDLGLLQLQSLETQYRKHAIFKEKRMKTLLWGDVSIIDAPMDLEINNISDCFDNEMEPTREFIARRESLTVEVAESNAKVEFESESESQLETETQSDLEKSNERPMELQFATTSELVAFAEHLREKLSCMTSTAPHAAHTTLLVVLQALVDDLTTKSTLASAESHYDDAERFHEYAVMLERTIQADVFVQTTPSEGGNGVQRLENMHILCSQADDVLSQLATVENKARLQHQFSKCKSILQLSNDIVSANAVLRKLLIIDPVGDTNTYPDECHMFFIHKLHEANRSLFDLFREAHNMKLYQYVIHHWPLQTGKINIKSTKTQPKLSDLKKAGYTTADLRKGGYGALELKICGYSASDVISVGYKAADLKAAGYEASDLKKAKYSVTYLKSAGYTASDLKHAGYSASSLATKSSGIDISRISSVAERNGYYGPSSPDSEKYNTYDVTHASYSAAELKGAGYDVYDLHKAGYSALALRKVEYSTSDMRIAGFSAADMKGGGYNAYELLDAGYGLDDVLRAGYSASYLKKNNFLASDLCRAGYSVLHLKDAGYSLFDITTAGYSVAELKRGGYNVIDLPVGGAGHTYSAVECRKAGYTLTDLVKAKYPTRDLKEAGYSAIELKPYESRVVHMKSIGFTASELKAAGYCITDLMSAKFKISDMRKAGYTADDLKPFYIHASLMRGGGYKASDLREVGYSAVALKEAGYGMDDVVRAGYPASHLKAVYGRGNSASTLRRAGYTAMELTEAKYRILDLKTAAYTASDMKAAGYSVNELKNVGYSFVELKNAGFEL